MPTSPDQHASMYDFINCLTIVAMIVTINVSCRTETASIIAAIHVTACYIGQFPGHRFHFVM